jgi:lysophospholipase L1-like esterase
MEPIRGLHWRGRPIGRAIVARLMILVLLAGGFVAAGPQADTAAAADVDCARRLLAGGDRIPAGQEVSSDERYPSQLVEDHLGQWGPWCVYNTAANGATSSGYITRGQLAESWNKAADLITVTVGAENDGIKKLFTDCFDKVKDHDFTGANVCAAQVLANEQAYTNLKLNLTTILQQYRVLAARRPNLVVAVTGYPNPYPSATEAALKVVALCVPLVDTIPTCSIRWAQLPPALATIDAAVKKLNSAIQEAVANFQLAANGQRFVYVDTYEKLRDHCMKMEVTIKTKVEHPEQSGAVHVHDSPPVNFGCSDPWFVEGSDGTKIPDYLEPAALGVLIEKSQTTKGMGIHPDVDGHDCISDLIFEADTIEPGTTPLKWKLNIAEAPATACD